MASNSNINNNLNIIEREAKASAFFKGISIVIKDKNTIEQFMKDAYDITTDVFYKILPSQLMSIKISEITEDEFCNATLSKKVPLGPAIRLDRLFDKEQLEEFRKRYFFLDKKYIGVVKRTKDFLSKEDKEYGFIEITADDIDKTSKKDAHDTLNIRIFVNPFYIDESLSFTESHVVDSLVLILKLLTNKYQTCGAFMYSTSKSRSLTTYYYVSNGNMIETITAGDALNKLHLDKKISISHTVETIEIMLDLHNSDAMIKFLSDETKKLYKQLEILEKKSISADITYHKSIKEIDNFIQSSQDEVKVIQAKQLKEKYEKQFETEIKVYRDGISNIQEELKNIEENNNKIRELIRHVNPHIILSYFKFHK